MSPTPPSPPLRFDAPPTWPVPSPEWVARYQGYRPPRGWLPPGASPETAEAAPANWIFWRPDETGWRAFRAPFVRASVRAVLLGWLMVAVAIGFTVIGYLGLFGGGVVAMFGLMIAGVVRLITGYRRLFGADVRAWQALGRNMPRMRDDLDSLAHAAYLTRLAERGSGADGVRPSTRPMSADDLALELELRPWLPTGAPSTAVPEGRAEVAPDRIPFPAVWPGVRWSEEPPWIVERREAVAPRRRRVTIAVVSAAAVALAVAIAVPLIVNPTHTLTNSALPTKGGRGASPVLVTGDDWKVVGSGRCSANDGCWQLEVTPESTCRDATIVWGFTRSQNDDVHLTRTTKLPLAQGVTAHVTIPLTRALEPYDYIELDDATCGA